MLSGNIEMNGVVIGEWKASHIRDYDGYRDYYCEIWYTGEDGYRYEAHWNMWGRHHRADGALSLAAKVIQQGMKEVHKRPVRIEDAP